MQKIAKQAHVIDEGVRGYNLRGVNRKLTKENLKLEVADLDSKLDKVSINNPSEVFAKRPPTSE